jgi:hypothetical protein
MGKSNGYEEIADRFIAARNPVVGAKIVCEWIRTLPQHASLHKFRQRFPGVLTEHAAV